MRNHFLIFSLLVVLFNLVIVSCTFAIDDPMLYFSFDTYDGNIVVDQSGNNHDGTVQGNATYTTNGISGGAYHFNGNPDAIRIGDLGTVLQGTISFWINPDVIEDWRNPFTTDYASWDDCIRFEENSDGDLIVGALGLFGYNVDQTFTTQLQANQWQHIAFAWDDTTNYGYFNGQLIFETPQPAGDYTYSNLGNQTAAYFRNLALDFRDVAIGNGYSTSPERWWIGSVDEVRIYDRTLLEEEVQEIYISTAVPEPSVMLLTFFGGLFMLLRRNKK